MSFGELVKRHCLASVQSLRLLEPMEAEVVAGPPDLKIKLKGNDKLIIPKELIVVAERLCRVRRKANITNAESTAISSQSFDGTVAVGAPVGKNDPIPPAHAHKLTVTVALKDRKFDLLEGEIHYITEDDKDDTLRAGDRVMAFAFEGGQKYFVYDRIVQY
ncbi:DUF2577 domain-containing protein [Paenibacillus antri]|uniref:DUF2577 domain-containing protein n=1 Tax=Paenibacillus antri TaxID=2582848 RepID=A0A5R9GCE9_9BACL|nr:DUF2577 family protein [Paenibacillus antri]TLS51750.1 DUF2577 domain-containing protein [Paenibacillus antri]